MCKIRFIALVCMLLSAQLWAQESEMSAEDKAYMEWAQSLWDGMEQTNGEVELPQAQAVFNVPDTFYFLSSTDANKVLTEIWGNPPREGILGMLFPAQYTPFDGESWGVTIEYQEDGHVSDEDAAEIDYTELLSSMQADSVEENKNRQAQGYEAISLVGWASPPFYDQQSHKLHWAKELKFGQAEQNTLNYNIRVLGRKGVLVLNFIASMSQLKEIEQNLDPVLAIANFQQGSTYDDFDPDIDQVAAYGLGALVAGKVLAKSSFIAMALIFLKKFGIFILIGLGALLRNVFKKKEPAQSDT